MEITPELITQYGLMNKISTGHTLLDLLLCLLVPLLLKHLAPRLADGIHKLWPQRNNAAKTFTRRIEFTQRSGYYWYDSDNQPSNSVLQRAILNVINMQVQALNELHEADFTLKKRGPGELLGAQGGDDGRDGEGVGGGKAGEEEEGGGSGGGEEHAYGVNLAPPEGTWVELKNGIRFMRDAENLDDKLKNTRITYSLECSQPDGSERIAAFVEHALEVYRKQQSARVDPARYLYMPVLPGFRPTAVEGGEGGSGGSSAALYKRYKLSEEKSFASLFHPDKDSLLRLVDQFLHKQGKFAIPGYPQKLGFLLYGPPGTGKTSLIKALAQHTKRSIISVPLSKISTNQELMDIVFDNKLQIQNSPSSDSASISLPFHKTIFVMEDVDAASSVVQRRTPPSLAPAAAPSSPPPHPAADIPACAATDEEFLMTAAAAAAAAQFAAAASASAASYRGSSSSTAAARSEDGKADPDQDKAGDDDGDGEGSEGEEDQRGGGKGKKKRAGTTTNNTTTYWNRQGLVGTSNTSLAAFGSGIASSPAAAAFGPMGPAFGGGGVRGLQLFRGDDELNLAGLLNVLDGVVDTPQRIIVMTTNHPDKLDPALIRPGRINKKIYMGRLRATEALSMVRHYFGALAAADEAALRRVWLDERLSPADLESMCAEYDTVAELVEAVAGRLAAGGPEGEGFKPC